MLLEDHELWHLVDKKDTLLRDVALLVEHNKKMSKAKRVILDLGKNHLIPHIIRKTTSKKMFDALGTLYKS
jgi:lysine/ornithine N-monooxygenase